MPLDLSALLALRPRQVVLRANADMKATLTSAHKALLLRSVAQFLETNGFSKTLKRFLSEADVTREALKGSASLEEIYSKFLEKSCDAKVNLKKTDNEAVADEVKKLEQRHDDSDESEDKKKKRKKKNISSESEPEKKTNVNEKVATEVDTHKNKTKNKEMKKQPPASATNDVESQTIESQADEKISKSKTKKKKKDDSKDTDLTVVESLKKEVVESKISDADVAKEEDSKFSKKRKRSIPDEDQPKPSDKIENEESKRRKFTTASEKNENGQENGIVSNGDQHINSLENGKIDQSIEKSGGRKSGKKESNGSAEPKKAFQRVKVDEVVFTDDRLKDNSYWAKSGADTGYGAKAEEILSQVRGRGFRHEKTKKKRGSYRGGQIDLQSHSIKFNYSDEE